jgi:hypothetical protein
VCLFSKWRVLHSLACCSAVACVLHLQAATPHAGSAWRASSSAVLSLQLLCAQRW